MNDTHTPDTHGTAGEPWIGFDLDGTLAVYDKWEGIGNIGEPVAPMVELMKKLHAAGKVVKILTARVAPRAEPEHLFRTTCTPPDYVATADFTGLAPDAKTWVENMYLGLGTWGAREFVVDWCLRHLGFLPEITHEKDHLMVTLYDDRVKQVVPNDGTLVEDVARDTIQSLRKCESDLGWALARLERKRNGFAAGLSLGFILAVIFFLVVTGISTWCGRNDDLYTRALEAHAAITRLIEVLPAQGEVRR